MDESTGKRASSSFLDSGQNRSKRDAQQGKGRETKSTKYTKSIVRQVFAFVFFTLLQTLLLGKISKLRLTDGLLIFTIPEMRSLNHPQED
jgi:hypothetical protein